MMCTSTKISISKYLWDIVKGKFTISRVKNEGSQYLENEEIQGSNP